MAEIRSAWNEAGDRLGELGKKLKTHYEAQHGTEGAQTKEDLADAAKRVGTAVQDAFDALGAAARDKSVQADVKQVGQSVYEALGATFGQVSEEVRRAFAERKGESVHGDKPGPQDASVYDTVPPAQAQPPAASPASPAPEPASGSEPGPGSAQDQPDKAD